METRSYLARSDHHAALLQHLCHNNGNPEAKAAGYCAAGPKVETITVVGG
jgi:hypothetical protein